MRVAEWTCGSLATLGVVGSPVSRDGLLDQVLVFERPRRAFSFRLSERRWGDAGRGFCLAGLALERGADKGHGGGDVGAH
jgi:hypothetical protein